ncbi:MAG TPA: YkvA family protein [Candidatus Sumerlaeota bacterium]|nr:YkvA family protein [Candidatus Sumerlaeota bacterium]
MPKTGTIEYTAERTHSGSYRARTVVRRSFLQRLSEGYHTFRAMLRDRNYHFPTALKIASAVLALYVFSPIDFVPDFLPMIGFADDTALIAGVFWMLVNEIANYSKSRGRD